MTRISFNQHAMQSLGIAAYIVVLISALPLTTHAVRSLSVMSRNAAMLLVAVSIILLWQRRMKIRVEGLFALVFLYIFYFYGMLLSFFNGGHPTAMDFVPTTLLIVTIGIILLSQRRQIIGITTAWLLLCYIVIILLATLTFGGLQLTYPPRFVFEFQTENYQSTVSYGQGVTKFFGIGAIIAGFLGNEETRRTRRVLLIGLCLFFLALSLLGGARGDSIAAVLCVVLIFLSKAPFKTIAMVLCGGLGAWYFLWGLLQVDDFIIVRRLSKIFDGSLGVRESLYAKAIDLIVSEPVCLFFGCGFDYYQYYFKHTPGLYPHNFILELVIVFGLPLVFILISLTTIGWFKTYLYAEKPDVFPFLIAYFFLIYFKSGSIISGWLFVLGLFHFCGVAVSEFWKTTQGSRSLAKP